VGTAEPAHALYPTLAGEAHGMTQADTNRDVVLKADGVRECTTWS
jgi:hypothetical protein